VCDDKIDSIITIRRMTFQDVAAGMRLKTVAGWNQTKEDWQLFLTLSPGGCFVATHEGKTIGTVTTLNYQNRVSWISMLLVDPAFRRMGVGTRLMRQAIASLAACQTIKLDATPAEKKLHQRLGFHQEYGLNRMAIARLPSFPDLPGDAESSGVRPMTDAAFPQVAELDRLIFGVDRTPVLKALAARSPGTARQWIDHGRVCGFCLGRPGTCYRQIRPVIAETCAGAIALCRAAMKALARQAPSLRSGQAPSLRHRAEHIEASGRAVVLDVPEGQEEFSAWLRGLGFVARHPFTRMYRGSNSSPGILESQFAISGPELG
jgi:ribosomal protein S18 acetylase RimI-like enzyme